MRRHLADQGHRVLALTRTPGRPDSIQWQPEQGRLDLAGSENLEAVIHLAGEPIACRWTESKKILIRDSRVQGTRLLSQALTRLPQRPRVLISASATGYYGDRPGETLTEASPPGRGFLAGVAQVWENAAEPARVHGIRVVHPRIGIVLSPQGGALAKMLPVFRRGLGGRFGSGRQVWSWIALEDLIRGLAFLLENDAVSGPVNMVAPEPVTNQDFTSALARALDRPAWLPVPGWAARLALGEMARETLLAGARVLPETLLRQGFTFQHPTLEPALRHLLDGQS
ncbi:MAG TPA: TIGR01777 family oxidoreductase [Verrucomicrobiae bacterium]|nr:TIGR01777 family oxidoreductase [Verrucomicrobiae bacterium]